MMLQAMVRTRPGWYPRQVVAGLMLEGTAMPEKGSDLGSKAVSTLVGAAAAFVARKAISFAWTKATGKEPPGKAEDPEVAIGEALAWTVVLGIGVAVARLLAVRLTTRQSPARALAGRPD